MQGSGFRVLDFGFWVLGIGLFFFFFGGGGGGEVACGVLEV